MLVKLRLADFWIRANHSIDGVVDEEELEIQESLALSAYTDLQRLSGEAGDDALVALWAKWHALEWRPVPEGLTDDEADNFNAQSADQADDVAIEIVSALPHTLIGAYAQIVLLAYWAENAVPAGCNAALARLYSRVEAALQDAARTAGEAGGEAASDNTA